MSDIDLVFDLSGKINGSLRSVAYSQLVSRSEPSFFLLLHLPPFFPLRSRRHSLFPAPSSDAFLSNYSSSEQLPLPEPRKKRSFAEVFHVVWLVVSGLLPLRGGRKEQQMRAANEFMNI